MTAMAQGSKAVSAGVDAPKLSRFQSAEGMPESVRPHQSCGTDVPPSADATSEARAPLGGVVGKGSPTSWTIPDLLLGNSIEQLRDERRTLDFLRGRAPSGERLRPPEQLAHLVPHVERRERLA